MDCKLVLANGDAVVIELRYARDSDNADILQLNKRWQRGALNENLENGFLSGAFSEELILQLISRNEILVACDGPILAGYIVTVNHLDSEILNEHRYTVQQLKKEGVIAPEACVAIGIQTALHPDYFGSGLISELRKEFIKLLKPRFQYLYTTISVDNKRSLRSSMNFGWQPMGEANGRYKLLLSIQ